MIPCVKCIVASKIQALCTECLGQKCRTRNAKEKREVAESTQREWAGEGSRTRPVWNLLLPWYAALPGLLPSDSNIFRHSSNWFWHLFPSISGSVRRKRTWTRALLFRTFCDRCLSRQGRYWYDLCTPSDQLWSMMSHLALSNPLFPR